MEKILIIEDDASIRGIICDILDLEGYYWHAAGSGSEGIMMAKEKQPDLIICDVMMPEINGHKVLEEIKNNPFTENIPFIFLTAMAEKKDVRTGMDLGADDYLVKPFTNDELLNAIRTRLKKYAGIKKKLNELRDSIAQSLPHELRTPLVSILGYSDVLIDSYDTISPGMLLEYSKTIHDAGTRLNRLIQNYIFYSKINIFGNDEKEEEPSAVSLPAVLKLVNKISKGYNREGDISVNLDECIINLKSEYFLKIVEELTDNAFKFSESGTPVEISSSNKEGFFILSFKDSGRGMSEEQVAGIGAFLQFERSKFEQQGSGLGLAITAKLLNACGGSLDISSSRESGTIVTAFIPR